MQEKTYKEQIGGEINKSKKQKNAARYLYYCQLHENNSCASVSFESYKGSWAGELWLKRNHDEIEELKKEFGWD
jgi:hypothetical protein